MNTESMTDNQTVNNNASNSFPVNATAETEWMINHKHAQLMSGHRLFQSALANGHETMFFSISDDKKFTVTIQTDGGWVQKDIGSNALTGSDSETYTPKLFEVISDTRGVRLCLVFGSSALGDKVYVATNVNLNDDLLTQSLNWKLLPFDGDGDPGFIDVRKLYSFSSGHWRYFAVDVHSSDDPNSPANRFHLNLEWEGKVWIAQPLQFNLDKVVSSISGTILAGPGQLNLIYTLGISGEEYILYCALEGNPQSPAQLLFPEGSLNSVKVGEMAMAVTLKPDGTTDLYIAGNGSLYYFASDQQKDGYYAQKCQLPDASYFSNVTQLSASLGDNLIIIGLSENVLFSTSCGAGNQLTQLSNPSPILGNSGVVSYASMLNYGDATIFFAHTVDDQMLLCSWNIETVGWKNTSIHLPPSDVNDMVEFGSYTTHITIVDNSNMPLQNFKAGITSSSPAFVYINNIYTPLNTGQLTEVQTDDFGVITIIQETPNISAVCYRLSAANMSDLIINPVTKIINKLDDIKDANDLDYIKNSDGTIEPLFDDPTKPVSLATKQAIADAIKKLVEYAPVLPADGSVQQKPPGAAASRAMSDAAVLQPTAVWGLSFEKREVRFHEGTEAIAKFGLNRSFNSPEMEASGNFDGGILHFIGTNVSDFFHWLHQKFDDAVDFLESIVVSSVDGIIDVALTVAGAVYHFVLDHLDAILVFFGGIIGLFAVGLERLRKWLGYVFNWDDIVRTHKVLKNIFKIYIEKSIQSVKGYEEEFLKQFDVAENWIKNWANIKDQAPASTNQTIAQANASKAPVAGQNHPAFNWTTYHLKTNVSNSVADSNQPGFLPGQLESITQPLESAIGSFEQELEKIKNEFQTEIYDQYQTLTAMQIMEKVVGILAVEVLEGLKELTQTFIQAINQLLDGVMSILESPIDIPVISEFYRTHISQGEDLSLLDLAAFISAIPVTVIGKIALGTNVFPDDGNTQQLINAATFDEFKQIVISDTAAARSAVVGDAAAQGPTVMQNIYMATGVMGLVGATGLSILTIVKKTLYYKNIDLVTKTTKLDIALAGAGAILYLPYVSPDIIGQIPDLQNKKWWAIFNQILADVAVVKQFAELGVTCKYYNSPLPMPSKYNFGFALFDTIINCIWLFPSIGVIFDADERNAPGYLNFFGGLGFDGSGILTIFIQEDADPDTSAILVGISTILNLIYGGLGLGAGIILYKGEA